MTPIDAILLEVLRHAFAAVAEEMNVNLIRTAYSPNIKERRDCSSALFDAEGQLVAQAESIPVHLGAMPFSVISVVTRFAELSPGDVVVVNDPYRGGAHLPDLTFVAPVFWRGRLRGFVANRAHHADIGGKEPGSIPGDAVEIFQEGLRIPPVHLWRQGVLQRDVLDLILLNVRTPDERWGDLRAQYAGCRTGIERLRGILRRHGTERIRRGMEEVLAYSERRMREQIERMPRGTFAFEDALDDDGIHDDPVPICAAVTAERDGLTVDFEGTAAQVNGPINAVLAVTASATYYAVRAATDPTIPPNAGCYRPIRIIAPEGSIVNARPPAAVVGGNLETAQRIVDVLLGALGKAIPDRSLAACQGTMNNVTMGGLDPRFGRAFTLYETVGGGSGGSRTSDGVDGVHTHMTNTLNTPVEALETAYPVRVIRYELIPGSGGEGEHRGGLGIRREIEIAGPAARVSILSDRRRIAPYGLRGGHPGRAGHNVRIDKSGHEIALPGKGSFTLQTGEILRIETPGGGGFGEPADRAADAVERDRREGRL